MSGKITISICVFLSLAYTYWNHFTHSKNVLVYRNGYSKDGVEMFLKYDTLVSKNGSEIAEYLSQFVDVETIKTNESRVAVADRVYNGYGQLIHSFKDIKTDDRLYLVAPELLFVWPFVKLGHKVELSYKDSPTGKPIILESFSESPRVFHIHNLFTEEEADRLINRTTEIDDDIDKLQRSIVIDENGDRGYSEYRTSENAWDWMSETANVIRQRAFKSLSIGKYTEELASPLQLLRYNQKQAYVSHTDYFDNEMPDENFDPSTGGSNRFATIFLYLSNVTRGGQTVFPLAEMPDGNSDLYNHPINAEDDIRIGQSLFGEDSWEYEMVEQCSTRLAAYPRKAHAILFYSQKPNGEVDPMSLHGGCPVLDGTKWAANLWVWNKRRYGYYALDESSAETKDEL